MKLYLNQVNIINDLTGRIQCVISSPNLHQKWKESQYWGIHVQKWKNLLLSCSSSNVERLQSNYKWIFLGLRFFTLFAESIGSTHILSLEESKDWIQFILYYKVIQRVSVSVLHNLCPGLWNLFKTEFYVITRTGVHEWKSRQAKSIPFANRYTFFNWLYVKIFLTGKKWYSSDMLVCQLTLRATKSFLMIRPNEYR